MGQKINPQSFRTGITKDWNARWFFAPSSSGDAKQGLRGSKRFYAKFLEEDEIIRTIVRKKIGTAGIAGLAIERTASDLKVLIKAARPGLVIGRGGKGIEELSAALENALKKVRDPKAPRVRMSVNVEELKRSEVSAAYIAQQIAWDLERRMPFRRTMKKYLDQTLQNRDVKGVKLVLSGRLGGADIARREMLKSGALPLQTLRANIDYGTATGTDAYGTMGVKVWIYKGEIIEEKE